MTGAFDHLETPLVEVPEFFVQAPDGRRDWSEEDRMATLFAEMSRLAPRVLGHHVPNEGKRNPWKAHRLGIRAGVFDTRWDWRHPLSAALELKGYDKRGQPGKLSQAQIVWGNRMFALGKPVACFFDPYAAIDWLRDQGFPIAFREAAA